MPTETHQPPASRPHVQAETAALPVRRGRRPRRTFRQASRNPLPALVLALFAVFFALPVLWLVLAATKTGDQLAYASPLSFGSWHALRDNWDALTRYQGDAIFLWLRNSAVYSFLALAITLAAVIPAGYALAMTEFRGRRALLIATLVVMVMPNTTLVVPLFLEINAVHLIGSMWSIILPYAFYPFGVYLAYMYYSTTLPKELLEAARLDGCTEFGTFRRVALPLAAPIVALIAFFSFVANWTNYFLPYVLLPESDQFPVQVGLGILAVPKPELALATLVAITPVLIVFLFCQRFLVSGMLVGVN